MEEKNAYIANWRDLMALNMGWLGWVAHLLPVCVIRAYRERELLRAIKKVQEQMAHIPPGPATKNLPADKPDVANSNGFSMVELMSSKSRRALYEAKENTERRKK